MNPKTEKITISLPGELAQQARARADEMHRGNFSAYVQQLIDRDLAGVVPEVMSPSVLTDLTKRLLGELDAEDMTSLMAGRDQRRELRWLLKTFMAQASGEPEQQRVAEPTDRRHPAQIATEALRRELARKTAAAEAATQKPTHAPHK